MEAGQRIKPPGATGHPMVALAGCPRGTYSKVCAWRLEVRWRLLPGTDPGPQPELGGQGNGLRSASAGFVPVGLSKSVPFTECQEMARRHQVPELCAGSWGFGISQPEQWACCPLVALREQMSSSSQWKSPLSPGLHQDIPHGSCS